FDRALGRAGGQGLIMPRSVLGVRGIESLTGTDLYWLARVADAVGTDLDYLATVIGFETGHTFDPAVKNRFSGATALIQFLPSTAKGLGTTVAELAAMSFAEQLAFVQRYLANYSGQIHSLENLYLSIFFPAAIHMSDDAVIASEGSAVYEQNKGFDSEQTGQIRRSDILRSIRAAYRSALDRPRVR